MRQALSILAPLGWVYGFGAALRRRGYTRGIFRQERLRSPVISVGGLAMGGSMKTPTVLELARALSARGPKVGVVGHGYRGADATPRVVSDGATIFDTADKAGDEAILLAHELPGCPVVVGRDKVAAGRLLEDKFGKRIVLVDSGFQHARLFRDLDVVCVTERDLGTRVLPAGALRESPRALRSAGLIFTDRETDGRLVAKLRKQRPDDVFSLSRTDFRFFPADGSGLEVPPPAKVFAFCGIGLPERFFKDLAVRGVSVAVRRAFRDHHPFSEQDLRDLALAAEKAQVDAVVTTTKDAVRIQTWPSALPLLVMSARLDIEDLSRVLKRIDRVILARIRAGL